MSRLVPHFNPFAQPIAAHPLFGVDAKRVRWGRSAGFFRRASLIRMVAAALVTAIVWAGVGFPLETLSRQDPLRYGYMDVYDIYLIMLGLSLLSGGLLDFSCLAASVGAISREISTGRWDLLRLTALNDSGLVHAKHAAAQARAWPRLMVIIGVRVALAVIGMVMVVGRQAETLNTIASVDFASERYVAMATTIVFTGLLATLYVIEPFWRVQAMTAFGVFISVRERHAPSALLSAFFGTLGIWLLQSIVFGAVLMGSGFLITFAVFQLSFSSALYFAICYNGVMICVFISAIYGFYHLIERWSLRRALHRVSLLN